MKKKMPGYIKLNKKLVRCWLIRTSPATGGRTVKLDEDCGAYKIGDIVNVGKGEFVKDD